MNPSERRLVPFAVPYDRSQIGLTTSCPDCGHRGLDGMCILSIRVESRFTTSPSRAVVRTITIRCPHCSKEFSHSRRSAVPPRLPRLRRLLRLLRHRA